MGCVFIISVKFRCGYLDFDNFYIDVVFAILWYFKLDGKLVFWGRSIIYRDSCHAQEHKHAAIRHMINRMNTYNLNKENKEKERNTIKHIISKIKFDTSLIDKFTNFKKKEKLTLENHKWAKFTYIGNETKFITKLFKDSPIKATFTTNNTIQKLLSSRPQPL
jgi:hypothetical protein